MPSRRCTLLGLLLLVFLIPANGARAQVGTIGAGGQGSVQLPLEPVEPVEPRVSQRRSRQNGRTWETEARTAFPPRLLSPDHQAAKADPNDNGKENEHDDDDQEDEKTLKDRVEELEEALEKLKEKQKEKDEEEEDEEDEEEEEDEREEVELEARRVEIQEEPSVQLTGRIHLDAFGFPASSPGIGFFENPDTGRSPEDRYFFRRLRLGAEGKIFETMPFELEFDFMVPNRPELIDAYFGFEDLPVFQTVLIGNQKRPLGLDYLNSSRTIVFMERPLVVEAFNYNVRRVGISSYGKSKDLKYTWRFGVFGLEDITTEGLSIGNTWQLSGNGRLTALPWYDEYSGGRGYLHLGIAGMIARPDGDPGPRDSHENEAFFRTPPELLTEQNWIDTGRIDGARWFETLGLEAMLNIGPLQVVGEYQNTWLQREAAPDLRFHGAYVYVAYFLTGEHSPYRKDRGILGRVEPFENFFLVNTCRGKKGGGWGAWQVALRYSYLDLSDRDVRGGFQQNVTFGLNWYWTKYSRLQFNALYGTIRNREPVDGFTGGHFAALGARFMVDF